MVATVSVLEHKGVGTLQRTAVLGHNGVGTRCRSTTGSGTTGTGLVSTLWSLYRYGFTISISASRAFLILQDWRGGQNGSASWNDSGMLLTLMRRANKSDQLPYLCNGRGSEGYITIFLANQGWAEVKKISSSCFSWRGETVYKLCSFKLRRQEEGESAASFINDVCALAEHCYYAMGTCMINWLETDW